jgi:HIV Tat-specific factor 1
LFAWHPDKLRGERSKHEKVVIVKNLFDPVIFDKEVPLLLEYQQDLREECSKCGDVRRVVIYDVSWVSSFSEVINYILGTM